MGFSRQEYWSGLPFPSPGALPDPGIEPRSSALRADSSPSEPPGKPKNTGVGNLSLPQGIFWTPESNWGLLHCRWILYQLSYQGSPKPIVDWKKKKKHNLKVENYVLFGGLSKNLSLPGILPLRKLWGTNRRGRGGTRMYRRFATKTSSWNIKRWLLIEENQTSLVKKLSTFLCVERCENLGSLKSLLW